MLSSLILFFVNILESHFWVVTGFHISTSCARTLIKKKKIYCMVQATFTQTALWNYCGKIKCILSIKSSFTFIWNDSILDIVFAGRCLALCFHLKSPCPAAATRLYTCASFCILLKSHTAAKSTRVALVSECVGCFVSWWRRLPSLVRLCIIFKAFQQ